MAHIFPIYLYRKLLKSSCQKPLDRFHYILVEIFPCWPSTNIVQVIMIRPQNMAARGRGLFSQYIYIEKFKKLLVRNHWTDFNITWQECFFGDPLPRLFKPSWFVKKTWPLGGGAYFPYISKYIENFKNLLVRNRWIEFNVTWQEFCFGDLLLRLRPQDTSKTWPSGGGAYFPDISV